MRQYYQIMVVVDGPEPPIWRRLVVSSTTTLKSFSTILRLGLSWEWAPSHSFARSPIDVIDTADEGLLRLQDVLAGPRARLTYLHDRDGDAWSHTVTLESIQSVDPRLEVPACLDGARATPRGSCLGPWHYRAWLQSMQDPATSEARRNCMFVGDNYDPEYFDCSAINRRLLRHRARPST